ncbi:MAG: acetylglutamate kinase [Candidatus Omnitrophota bacterium]|jgi:acetylglutamate kinase
MEEAIKKSKVLIEALPYIKKFFNKVVVIKYGGSSLGNKEVRESVLHDIVFMRYAGMKPVLVHGGGPDITGKLKEANIKAKFVGGLRVTSKEAMKVIDSVLMGLNKELVAQINEFGGEAFGLSGKENNMIQAVKVSGEEDLGFVGKVKAIDTTVLERLVNTNVIPVICPVGKGSDNEFYNINADEAASNIAVSLDAEKFVLLTNVRGVMKDRSDPESLFHSLTFKETEQLVKEGVIDGGMLPKTKACLHAVEGGVRKAHIVEAALPHALLLEIFTDKGIGTEIVRG